MHYNLSLKRRYTMFIIPYKIFYAITNLLWYIALQCIMRNAKFPSEKRLAISFIVVAVMLSLWLLFAPC